MALVYGVPYDTTKKVIRGWPPRTPYRTQDLAIMIHDPHLSEEVYRFVWDTPEERLMAGLWHCSGPIEAWEYVFNTVLILWGEVFYVKSPFPGWYYLVSYCEDTGLWGCGCINRDPDAGCAHTEIVQQVKHQLI